MQKKRYDNHKIVLVFNLGLTKKRRKKMNKALKVVGSVAVMAALCFVASSGWADDIFEDASTKMSDVFNNVRRIVFIMGAFALVGFAIAAIFGKLEWKKVAILAVGLALLAVAGKVVEYAVSQGSGLKGPSWSIEEDRLDQ